MEEARNEQAAAAQDLVAESGDESDPGGSGDERQAADNDNDQAITAGRALQEARVDGQRDRSTPSHRGVRAWGTNRGLDIPRAVVPGLPPAHDPRIRLPKYSGQHDLQTFLMQLETAAEFEGWSDRATTAQLILALEGEALAALEGLPDRHDGEAIITALQDRFGQMNIEERSVALLQDRVRKEGEPLAIFAAELRKLVRRGYPLSPRGEIDRTLRRAFLRGLTPEWLRRAVACLPATDFSTTLHEAHRIETDLAPLEKPQPRPPAPRVRAAQPEAEQEREEEEEVTRQATTPAAPSRPTGRGGPCYRCQEAGHVAEDCEAPKPRNRPACRRCGQGGHQAGDCEAPRKQDRKPSPPAGNGRGVAQ